METWQIILGLIALTLLIVIAIKLLRKIIRASKIRSLHSKISALDLRSISKKAKRELEWTDHRTNVAVEKYRRFLFLLGKYEGQMLAPFDDDTDKIWHYHIQDTRRYKKDCETLFGRFIDHNPDLTNASQARAEKRTREISQYEYGNDGYIFVYDPNPVFIPVFQEHTPSISFAEVSVESENGWGGGSASVVSDTSNSGGGWFGGGISTETSGGGSGGWGGGGNDGGGGSGSDGGGGGGGGGGCGGGGGGCGGGGCGGS